MTRQVFQANSVALQLPHNSEGARSGDWRKVKDGDGAKQPKQEMAGSSPTLRDKLSSEEAVAPVVQDAAVWSSSGSSE